MAHFAQINEDNIVIQVLVVPDAEEHRGEEYLHELGLAGRWVQTSITNRIRGVFALQGMVYLPEVDKFMPSKPTTNPSFVFDKERWAWVHPIAEPADADMVVGGLKQPAIEDIEVEIEGEMRQVKKLVLPENPKIYVWNEEAVTWDLLPPPPALDELPAPEVG